ncbi:hypothetical protein GUITHDRAFT_144727 [Guillardia theta CCMP2712]|uniref:PDZ domain-containing protein n=1 Tax=Guillardia theta (strain CCMP2712) TaxID=905079 RepID=L1INA0_GUITC|nr:hypothetical protein GUITHDRAFT_144727 [Guillardia theta CCMP2712]EKX37756.1 hypothetical protein GUITHDRAFT_144727 [Guillardia theta CCMP2712]|eukprot:XP_005824736.1 hypothetical protein GUITHDRAFT_144727 [Guillardia theta CCMP2712]
MAAAGDDKSTAKTSPASLQPSQGPQISQISQGQEVQTSSGMRILSSYDFAGPSLGSLNASSLAFGMNRMSIAGGSSLYGSTGSLYDGERALLALDGKGLEVMDSCIAAVRREHLTARQELDFSREKIRAQEELIMKLQNDLRQVAPIKQEMQGLQSQCQFMQEQNQQLLSTKAELLAELAQTRQQYEEMMRRSEAIAIENDAHRQEREMWMKSINQMSNDKSSIENELMRLKAVASQSEMQFRSFGGQMEVLDSQIATFRQRLAAEEQAKAQLMGENDQLKMKCYNLEAELERMRVQFQTQQSLPPQQTFTSFQSLPPQQTFTSVQSLPMQSFSAPMPAVSSMSFATFSGQGVGVGIKLKQGDSSEGVTIQSLVPGGPAAESGKVKEGDRILKIDDQDVSSLNIEQVFNLVKGSEGTSINLVLGRNAGGQQETIQVNLTRRTPLSQPTITYPGMQQGMGFGLPMVGSMVGLPPGINSVQ